MRDQNKDCIVGAKLRFWTLLVMICLLGAGAKTASTQVVGSISGVVVDPSGAAVPSASVTATNEETGLTRVMQTDAAGNYKVLSLPVGRYEVKAEKTGFKVAIRKGINLAVGQAAVVSLTLEVGQVQEQVTVTSEAAVVNTTTSSVSGLVGEKQVKELPLNGRSFDQLITLNPGAINYSSEKAGAQAGTTEGNFFTVAGRRPSDNLFLLNGIEYIGGSNLAITPGGVSGQLLGIDAVREFNVLTDAYSAEYGKRAGAQVSIVTQSGTNQLHGAAFEFLRNDKLDARNFFDQSSIPAFRRNQFGGALGGPIQRDKTFLFGAYEGFRQRLGISSVTIVPDDNARRGLLPIGPGGAVVPVSNVSPLMLSYANSFWPAPNGRNLGGGLALAFSNPKQAIREDFGTARLDQNISDKDSFSGVYTIDDGDNLTPLRNPFFGSVAILRTQLVSAQETHIFSPQLINTFRAGFSRAGFLFNNPNLVPVPSNLQFLPGKGFGPLVVGGGFAISASAVTPGGGGILTNTTNFRNLFSFADDFQVIRGIHQLSIGGWLQRVQVNANGASLQAGQAVFPDLESFLQGRLTLFSAIPNPTALGWRSYEGAWYVQDNIQLRPDLSLRIGVRHEFTNGWNETSGRAANFIADPSGVLVTAPRVADSVFTTNNAKKLFAPRVGLAWDPFGKGKTSVRGGFGIHYSLNDNLGLPLELVPPFNSQVSFLGASLPSIIPIQPGVPPPPSCGPGVPQPCSIFEPDGVQPNLQTPTVYEWNFSMEQQLTANMAFRVTYVGSHSIHNLINIDPNTIPLQTCSSPAGCTSGGVGAARGAVPQGAQFIPVGQRPNPFLSNGFRWFSEGNASYHALLVDLNRRFGNGLTFRANYTFSKNLDDGSGLASSQAQNQAQQALDPRNVLRDYGLSALYIQHQGGGNFGYELPFGHGKRWLGGMTGVGDKLLSGWQVNGIVTLQSGFPFTPQVGSNQSGDGNLRNPDRPNRNPAFSGRVVLGRTNQWFNPAAFSLPTPGTYGDLGRGTFIGPGLGEFDFSVFKTTTITERSKLEFRAEFFNLTNSANFSSPNPVVFSRGQISSSAGLITSTANFSRQIQFGLKLIY